MKRLVSNCFLLLTVSNFQEAEVTYKSFSRNDDSTNENVLSKDRNKYRVSNTANSICSRNGYKVYVRCYIPAVK